MPWGHAPQTCHTASKPHLNGAQRVFPSSDDPSVICCLIGWWLARAGVHAMQRLAPRKAAQVPARKAHHIVRRCATGVARVGAQHVCANGIEQGLPHMRANGVGAQGAPHARRANGVGAQRAPHPWMAPIALHSRKVQRRRPRTHMVLVQIQKHKARAHLLLVPLWHFAMSTFVRNLRKEDAS